MSDTAIYSWDGAVLGHYPEPKDVYFYSPDSPLACEWNLGLDKKDVDNWNDNRIDNWECLYCDSLHPLAKYRCANCGAVRVRG